jgi:hypothetical protein
MPKDWSTGSPLPGGGRGRVDVPGRPLRDPQHRRLGQQAAVDVEGRAGDEARLVAGQERDRRGDVGRGAGVVRHPGAAQRLRHRVVGVQVGVAGHRD